MQVQAYVYDVSQGMAATMSMALVGKQVDIVPHTGIVVFGKEYFFGSGPCIGEPGKTVPVAVSKVIDLGQTSKTCAELEAHINSVLASEHTPENYSLLHHNCNHYANDVAKFLLNGKGLPDGIVNIAQEALSTPQGQNLRMMIENMDKQMRSGIGGGSSLNPYANVGSSGSTAPVPAAPAASAEATDPELESALEELASKNDVEVQRAALTLLLKITENVVNNPGEPKFRRIKMSNAAFKNKIDKADGGVDIMVAAGWLPDCTPEGEDCWVMPEEADGRQQMPKRRLAEQLAKLPAAPSQPATPAPAPVPPAPAADPFGGMGGLGGLGGPGGMPNPQMMQQMMNNPQMMQQAQQMMQNNPQMMAQAQQMMQNPQAMAQVQQMMQNNPQMMQQMQQMMGQGGFGGMGGMP
jgi:hypothetical protein